MAKQKKTKKAKKKKAVKPKTKKVVRKSEPPVVKDEPKPEISTTTTITGSSEPVIAKTVIVTPEPTIESTPKLEPKISCPCCRTLVPESDIRTCSGCSFQGCVKCRPSGTCPTCNKRF